MSKWKAMHANTKHALEMEAKTYKDPTHITMIQEIIANAHDAFNANHTENPTVEIILKKIDNDEYIIFHNNANPIPEKFFKEKYQTLYESSKIVGEQIGFVGIGAKIFLPSHKNAEIITITGDRKKLVSKWICNEKGPQYTSSLENQISDIVDLKKFPHENGTTFICKLSHEQYSELESKLEYTVYFWWNYALLTKLFAITVNGKKLESKFPSTGNEFSKKIMLQGQRIDLKFFISDNELGEEFQNIIYVVHGKRIDEKKINTSLEVKGNFGNKIFCYADVTCLAKHVIKSKEGFEKHRYVTLVKTKTRIKFWDFIKEQGLYKDKTKTITKNIELEKLTERINTALQSAKFKDLNPFLAKLKQKTVISSSTGHESVSEADGSQTTKSSNKNNGNKNDNQTIGNNAGTGTVSDDDGKKSGETKPRKTSGINIIEVEHDESEKKEAYVSEQHSAVVINIGHPFYKKIEGTMISEFHKYKIVIDALIRYQTDAENWDVETAFDKAQELLHDIYD